MVLHGISRSQRLRQCALHGARRHHPSQRATLQGRPSKTSLSGTFKSLDEMGVSRNQSSRWQGLAEVDDQVFLDLKAEQIRAVAANAVFEIGRHLIEAREASARGISSTGSKPTSGSGSKAPPTTTWPWPSVCLTSRGLETLPARPSTCLPGRPCRTCAYTSRHGSRKRTTYHQKTR
jgi:hypothetical protein